MRLIDADALDSKIESHYKHKKIDRYDHDLLGHYIDAEMAPTIDAEPVRHGVWTDGEDKYWVRATCSVCGSHPWRGVIPSAESLRASGQYNYCPTCGAKMDGDAHAAD